MTICAGGRPVEVALGYALGVALETLVAVHVLGRGRHDPLRIVEDGDLTRFFGAATAAASGRGPVRRPDLGAHRLGHAVVRGAGGRRRALASQLCVVPIFARLPTHGAVARPRERVAQWLAVLVVVPVVFVPRDFPSLAFVVIPLLAWTALRSRPIEALVQMCAVVGCAIVMTTYGSGPFAGAPAFYGLDHDTRGVLLGLLRRDLRADRRTPRAAGGRSTSPPRASPAASATGSRTSCAALPAWRSSAPTPRAG